jgi:hypothetical protein
LRLVPTQPPTKWVTGILSPLKAAGAWSWPFTSLYFRGLEWMELQLHASFRLFDLNNWTLTFRLLQPQFVGSYSQ